MENLKYFTTSFFFILSFFISSSLSSTFIYNTSYPCAPPMGCSLLNPKIYNFHNISSPSLPGTSDTIVISSLSPSLFLINSSSHFQRLECTTQHSVLVVANNAKLKFENILWNGTIEVKGTIEGETVSAEVLSFEYGMKI